MAVMFEFIEIIVQLLNMSWRQFQLLLAGFATLGVGAAVAEIWPFGGDKTEVLNWWIRIAMVIACGIYVYIRFVRKPRDREP